MDYVSLGLGILIGCFLGGIAVFAFFGRKTEDNEKIELAVLQTQVQEQKKHAKEMQERMHETFAAISQQAIDQNSKGFLQLAETKFAPFKELLSKTQTSVQDLENKRVKAYAEVGSTGGGSSDPAIDLLGNEGVQGGWGQGSTITDLQYFTIPAPSALVLLALAGLTNRRRH